MFEYVESVVNEDVEISTMNFYVEYTSKLEMETKLKKEDNSGTDDVGILEVKSIYILHRQVY